MSSSSFSSSFFNLLTFVLFLQGAVGLNPLSSTCSTSDNFTAYGRYESNLNELTSYLSYSTPLTGFGMGSLGKDPNQVSGLALCRGDINSTDCKTCVAEAGSEIRKRCPYGKSAIIWYDYCELKYADEFFFGQIDNSVKVYMWNTQNASDPSAFNQNTENFVSAKSHIAWVRRSLASYKTMPPSSSQGAFSLVVSHPREGQNRATSESKQTIPRESAVRRVTHNIWWPMQVPRGPFSPGRTTPGRKDKTPLGYSTR